MSLQTNLRLFEARTARGWSQEQLAGRLGVTRMSVYRWETGKTYPPRYYHQNLVEVFGLSAKQLGLEVGGSALPATQEAHASLFDPVIPTPPPEGLVGRDDLLVLLRERVVAGVFFSLVGLPGVGKTSLAVMLTYDPALQVHFEGILWAGLGRSPDILGHLVRWGGLLGVQAPERSSVADWARALRFAISERRLLIVLDDAWTIEDTLALKVGGPGCAYLLTTRVPKLAAYASRESLLVPELETADGVHLLERLAPQAVKTTPQMALKLVWAMGGLPLALTLVGNWWHVRSTSERRIRQASEHLQDAAARQALTTPQAVLAPHPSLPLGTPLSLEQVIRVSIEGLKDEERAALYALSVLPPKPNSFSREMALAVANCPEETFYDLLDGGLVEVSGQERYSLHQTIADFAHLQLEDAAARERLAAYFAGWVEAKSADNGSLERESANVLAALEAAYAQGQRSELVRLVNGFAHFLQLRGQYALAEHHLLRARKAAMELEDAPGQASICLHLGDIARKRAELQQAQDYYQEELSLAR